MKPDKYILQRNYITEAIMNNTNVQKDSFLVGKFNVTSASLSNFLPEIDHKQHDYIFKSILVHQQLSLLEQSTLNSFDYVTYENLNDEVWSMLKGGPSIICTFHTGSYRLINLFLAKYKVPYSLVVGSNVMNDQGAVFQNLYEEISGNSCLGNFNIIDAEKPSSIIQMLRELKKGRKLLMYMDGNSGSGTETINNENSCMVTFLNQMIAARKGIGYLAHAADVPILIATSYRKKLEDIRIRFMSPIYPNKDISRQDFAAAAIQNIYDSITPLIREYPDQWEAWLYLYKVAHIVNRYKVQSEENAILWNTDSKLKLNTALFSVFSLVGESFLFNKNNYTSHPISNEVFTLLSACVCDPIMRKSLDKELARQLCDNHVLISA